MSSKHHRATDAQRARAVRRRINEALGSVSGISWDDDENELLRHDSTRRTMLPMGGER